MIKRYQPDVLHLHMPNASAFWALLLPRARSIPWVIQWHSDVVASIYSRGLRLFYMLYAPFERALLRRTKKVIVSSPPYMESSVALAPFRDKCTVIPLGLDPASVGGVAEREDVAGDNTGSDTPLVVLAVGRLTYYKGFEYLLRAVSQVDNVILRLVGTGDQEMSLMALAGELKVEHKVTFCGALPEDALAQEFRRCDCLCLPSIERTEAFGLVLLEAMCCARATVASDVAGSGMGWIVDDGVTGIKVAPESTAELVAALQYLQHNRDKIAEFGRSGQRKFNRQFHIDHTTKAIIDLYRNLLESA